MRSGNRAQCGLILLSPRAARPGGELPQSGMNEQTLHLRRDGLTLSAELYGEDSAPLVILLHGFPDTPYSWDGVVPELVSAGYRVLTPWLRGYTVGSARRDARYDLIAVAEDIEAWRQHLVADQVHLVGHDWGAVVAMVLSGTPPPAAAHAGPWKTFSLLAVPPMPHRSQWRRLLPHLPQQLRLSSYMPVMQLGFSHRLLTRNNAAYVRKIWHKWSPGWAFDDAAFAPARLVFSDPRLAWASTRYYRNLFTLQRSATREAFKRAGRRFRVPTLALAGDEDGCMSAQTHRIIAQAPAERGMLRAAQLEGCGHFLQAEQPARVSALLLEHFRRVDQA